MRAATALCPHLHPCQLHPLGGQFRQDLLIDDQQAVDAGKLDEAKAKARRAKAEVALADALHDAEAFRGRPPADRRSHDQAGVQRHQPEMRTLGQLPCLGLGQRLGQGIGLMLQRGGGVPDRLGQDAAGRIGTIGGVGIDRRAGTGQNDAADTVGLARLIEHVARTQKRRLDQFDFDLISLRFGDTQSPGIELYDNYASRSAQVNGSGNVIGLKDPAVDALIDAVVASRNRAERLTAVHALDRVLRHGYYIIPHWYSATHRVAWKRGLAWPQRLPLYYQPASWMLESWWLNPGR